ncbi:uncharacterized protein LOC131184921 [Ahaetulla prasina]|uniref:uncharacterized protein LOC131184921 n=1 Tax=Ahaetulla prasina TaxID=499056 RepID=UPI00264A223D|nr:uncharacterized protein LOC131184921 [Ahaetulla prasina]
MSLKQGSPTLATLSLADFNSQNSPGLKLPRLETPGLKDKMKLVPEVCLQPSGSKLKLYSGELMNSLGLFQTECSIYGDIYKLEFEIVEADQKPLLSGSTCEHLGLMQFTIPAELHNVVSYPPLKSLMGPLTKQQILQVYQEVFEGPIVSVPGEVHFELDPAISPVQSAPRNVPIAIKQQVKAQLDKYEVEGRITSVTDPTSNTMFQAIITGIYLHITGTGTTSQEQLKAAPRESGNTSQTNAAKTTEITLVTDWVLPVKTEHGPARLRFQPQWSPEALCQRKQSLGRLHAAHPASVFGRSSRSPLRLKTDPR